MEACCRICVLVGWPRRIEGGNFGMTRELPRRHEDRWRRWLISVYFIGIFLSSLQMGIDVARFYSCNSGVGVRIRCQN
jgi:hypothetical protein